MLSDYLNKNTVRLMQQAADKHHAIRLAGDLLVNTGSVDDEYVAAMSDVLEEMGPYMVISPGLALAHARPSEHVIRNGVSLVTLREGVAFGHASNDPVSIVMAIAATQARGHLDAMKAIARLMTHEQFFPLLKRSEDIEEILRFIRGNENR